MSYEYLGSSGTPTSSVDWVTVSREASDTTASEMHAVRAELDPDYALSAKEWRFFGYIGYTYGKFSLGMRGKEGLMQFRGFAAEDALHHIPSTWKATRIDLQASVLLEQASPVAERYFQALGGSNRIIRPMLRFMSSSNEGGDTLYIGSRKSLQMGRVYDKGAESRIGVESEMPSKLYWRYEVELKGSKAVAVYNALRHHKDSNHQRISTFVHDWFAERGIVPAFTREGVNLVIDAAIMKATENDEAQRKLAWLVRCVAPVIHGLRKEYTDFTLLEALNLLGEERPVIGS